jgi:hypothetical protein
MFVNDPSQDTSYRTFEIALMKRPAQGWQAGASYSSTWANVPLACSTSGSGLGSGTPVVWATSRCLRNPNVAFNTADKTREWQVKLSGAYNLPFGIMASGNYDIRSGAPQARQVVFTGGRTIRSIALNVEPRGSFHLPNTHELDVRAAKRIALGPARSLEARVDIYNALNKDTTRAWNLQSGANYLRPSLIMFPRIVQVGATLNF